MRVENMYSPRTGREVANQFVITDDGKMTFQSYSSMIVEVDYNNHTVTIGKDYNYSVTTSKYRNQFFTDWTVSELRPLADLNTLRNAMKNGEFEGWKIVS